MIYIIIAYILLSKCFLAEKALLCEEQKQNHKTLNIETN